MSQTIYQQTPPDQHAFQASGGEEALPWQLDADQQLLKYLDAQRIEQLEQRVVLQEAGANQKSISIVESQITILDHAIREAEEQATLHARQAAIPPGRIVVLPHHNDERRRMRPVGTDCATPLSTSG